MSKKRKLIYGVGIADQDYEVRPKDGQDCKVYRRWLDMLTRCYSEAHQKTCERHHGCTVCEEWFRFSTFKKWMEGQDWEGKKLILVHGEVYCPDSCIFTDKIGRRGGRNKTSMLYGVGVNDATYVTEEKVGGTRVICPFFARWKNMIKRCYHPSSLNVNPTYRDCTVHPDWLVFSSFKSWMEQQEWEGNHLDKDILDPYNKVYGPDTCIFISSKLNHSITRSEGKRGKHPLGVCYYQACNKYGSRIGVGKVSINLGFFETAREAYHAYVVKKEELLLKTITEQTDTRIMKGLQLLINKLWEDYHHYVNTGEFK